MPGYPCCCVRSSDSSSTSTSESYSDSDSSSGSSSSSSSGSDVGDPCDCSDDATIACVVELDIGSDAYSRNTGGFAGQSFMYVGTDPVPYRTGCDLDPGPYNRADPPGGPFYPIQNDTVTTNTIDYSGLTSANGTYTAKLERNCGASPVEYLLADPPGQVNWHRGSVDYTEHRTYTGDRDYYFGCDHTQPGLQILSQTAKQPNGDRYATFDLYMQGIGATTINLVGALIPRCPVMFVDGKTEVVIANVYKYPEWDQGGVVIGTVTMHFEAVNDG